MEDSIKLSIISQLSGKKEYTPEFLENIFQRFVMLDQDIIQRDLGGDALVQKFMDVCEEGEFKEKIHTKVRLPEGSKFIIIGNAEVGGDPPTGGYKGFIIECHNNHNKTRKGLLTSIGHHAGKLTREHCSDEWKTGEALRWEDNFYKHEGICRRAKDLRGRPIEEFRDILRKVIS